LLTATRLFAAGQPQFFANPICEQADPWIVQEQGHYYACFSEGNLGISVHESGRLTVIGPKHVVWTAPSEGPASAEVWAPELHRIGGKWYIYFAASDGQNKNHRAWVLESAGDSAFGPYTLHGPLYTGDDRAMASDNRWAIDMTVFERNHRLYAIWSGWKDDQDVQYLYIAPMKDPVTIAAPRVRLCANNDFDWERVDESPGSRGLNEAPEVLQHEGRTFVTYSCSGSWQPSYKIGLLELKPGSDPLDPRNWTKHSKPAFQATFSTFGVGHNSFVKSPDGTEDWLIYHAKMYRANGWQRAVFVQRYGWDANGLPDFGKPVAAGQLLAAPSGETAPAIADARYFKFDGPDDLQDWSYFGHHQMIFVEGGMLHLGKARGAPVNQFSSGEKVIFNGGQWKNFILTAKIANPRQHGQAGLLFRVNTPFLGYSGQKGYFTGINFDTRTLQLGYTDGKYWHRLASAPLSGPPAAEYEFKVIARNNQLEVRCNNEPPLRAQDAAFASGTIGLRVVDAHAAFAGVQIDPLKDGDRVTPLARDR
jgi:GH43 family beta-xylosidase